MQQNRRRYLAWLGLICLLTAMVGGLAAEAQEIPYKYKDNSWGGFTFGFGPPREELRLNREDVITREGACPTGGCVLQLNKVEVLPPRGRQGETLKLVTTYTILTPEQVALPITITREIFFQGKSLGQTKSMDNRRFNGTWSHEVDFKLPANAVPGTYTLNTRVSTGYAREQKSVEFQVY
jgi:hypothetical protein